jgi:uncharacterized protein (TIGR03437 family)
MRAVGAVLLMLAASLPVYADVVFSDTTFNLSTYANTPSYTANGASTTISQCGGCGNPGSALQAVASFINSSTPGFADGGIVNTTFVYNPATQGAIESLSASVDKNESVNYTPNNGGLFTTAFHPMIEQDGKYYIATIPGPGFAGGTTGFVHFSQSGMAASDFTQYDFTTGTYLTGNPDFNGDPMMFGIASLASSSNGIVFTLVDDNLSFDLVTSPMTPMLTVAPGVVSFNGAAGSSAALQQAIVVQNPGSGSVNFNATVVSGSPWVSISPSSGTVAAGSPVFITVTANAQGLAAGSYRDIIQLFSATAAAAAPVSLFVANPGPILWARPAGVLFNIVQGSGSTGTQTLFLSNRGSPGSSANWTVAPATGPGIPNGNFLTFGSQNGQIQAGGVTNVSLALNSNVANLTAGVYYELVEVSDKGSQNSPQYVTAVLNVTPASVGAQPAITPGGLLFTGATGQAVASQQIAVNSSQTLTVQPVPSLPPGQSWLQATPASVNASSGAPAVMTVAINTSGLAAGVYTGAIELLGASSAAALGSVNVTLILTPNAALEDLRGVVRSQVNVAGCTPSALVLTETGVPNNFSVPAGWPANLITTMTDDCGNAIDGGSVTANFSNGDSPLALEDQGSGGQYIGTWQPSKLSNMVVTLNGSGGGLKPATARLAGLVTQNQAPVLSPNGILNNLNPLIGGALAPGTVAAAFGSGLTTSPTSVSPGTSPLPTEFQNTQLIVGGSIAPLYFLSDLQLNVEIPADLAPLQQYPAVGVVNGALSLPVAVPLVPTDPGIATNPDGSVIAQDSNFNLITPANPAHPGEAIVIYLVGMGATNPAVASGVAAPGTNPGDTLASATVQPVVQVGLQTAKILFAGLTPGAIGLYQINFVVPGGVGAGNTGLTVNQGGISANETRLPVAVP